MMQGAATIEERFFATSDDFRGLREDEVTIDRLVSHTSVSLLMPLLLFHSSAHVHVVVQDKQCIHLTWAMYLRMWPPA
jgi:hypothetical protein